MEDKKLSVHDAAKNQTWSHVVESINTADYTARPPWRRIKKIVNWLLIIIVKNLHVSTDCTVLKIIWVSQN